MTKYFWSDDVTGKRSNSSPVIGLAFSLANGNENTCSTATNQKKGSTCYHLLIDQSHECKRIIFICSFNYNYHQSNFYQKIQDVRREQQRSQAIINNTVSEVSTNTNKWFKSIHVPNSCSQLLFPVLVPCSCSLFLFPVPVPHPSPAWRSARCCRWRNASHHLLMRWASQISNLSNINPVKYQTCQISNLSNIRPVKYQNLSNIIHSKCSKNK